jgi:hypothetical protein
MHRITTWSSRYRCLHCSDPVLLYQRAQHGRLYSDGFSLFTPASVISLWCVRPRPRQTGRLKMSRKTCAIATFYWAQATTDKSDPWTCKGWSILGEDKQVGWQACLENCGDQISHAVCIRYARAHKIGYILVKEDRRDCVKRLRWKKVEGDVTWIPQLRGLQKALEHSAGVWSVIQGSPRVVKEGEELDRQVARCHGIISIIHISRTNSPSPDTFSPASFIYH